MKMKKQILLSLGLCGLVWHAHAYHRVLPGHILGRELNVNGAGWMGHVGLATAPLISHVASQVLEVLNEKPVIQLNSIAHFKTRSRFWGSRRGIADTPYDALHVLREGNLQKDLNCTTYTLTTNFSPSRGFYTAPGQTICTVQGQFRCDTYIYYLYLSAGYHFPIGQSLLPMAIFRAFPYGNGDGPHARTPLPESKEKPSSVSFDSSAPEALADMPLNDFYSLVDTVEKDDAKQNAKHLLELAKLSQPLSTKRRVFLIDKLSFLGEADLIPELISLYFETVKEHLSGLSDQILSTIQLIYQRQGCGESSDTSCQDAKSRIQAFYLQLLNSHEGINQRNVDLLVRGILMTTPKTISARHSQAMSALIDDEKLQLNPSMRLTLKMELLHASTDEDMDYLSDILQLLQAEDNSELEQQFNRYLIARIINQGQQSFSVSMLDELKTYLGRIQFKYDVPEGMLDASEGRVGLFAYGIWLEAKALTHTDTLDEAAAYIDEFLGAKASLDEQEKYVIGLSNSKYMQKAFETLPTLKSFKEKREDAYRNTVGVM